MTGLKELAARDQARAPTLGKGEAVIKLGSTGDRVAILQRVLGQPCTGVMSQDDVRLLVELQKFYPDELVADGYAGPATWRIIAKLYNDLLSNGEE